MTLKPTSPSSIVYDDDGRPYVPLRPNAGTVNVPLGAMELVEMWRLHQHAAAVRSMRGEAEMWKFHETQARWFLDLAVELDPLAVRLAAYPPHYGVEGKG